MPGPLGSPRVAPWVAALVVGGALTLGGTRQARAAPDPALRGRALAKKGQCVEAVPLLEEAELARHRPAVSLSLAECYVALGELMKALELLRSLRDEAEAPPSRTHGADDRAALRAAPSAYAAVDARVPTLLLDVADAYDELEVTLDGRPVDDVTVALRVAPDLKVELVATARGRREARQSLVLTEGEKRTVRLVLEREAPLAPKKPPPPKHPGVWLGARYDGYVLPQFMMSAGWAGGTTVFVPGGGLTVTARASDADVVVGLGYQRYRMPETAFLPNGAPDTDFEIVEADMHALSLTLDLLFRVPLDASETVALRLGGTLGVGVMLGSLVRTQAYPAGDPSQPGAYAKCLGPNNPPGSFRYCNQLDADADHYGGYREPSWFEGGAFPTVFPVAALPMLGLSYRPSAKTAIDLDVGLALSGVRTSLGLRFGL
jgi:hypothetical protein